MKTTASAAPFKRAELSDDDIREYAYHLYEQSGRIPGRDLENWLEAKACLETAIPKPHSSTRPPHSHRHRPVTDAIAFVTMDTENIAVMAELPDEIPAPDTGANFAGTLQP